MISGSGYKIHNKAIAINQNIVIGECLMEEQRLGKLNIEKSVIGAMCIDSRIIPKISFLEADDFQSKVCAYIFQFAVDCLYSGKIFDAVIASKETEKILKSDANQFIADCMAITPTVNNAEYHAKLIKQNSIMRSLRDNITKELMSDKPLQAAGRILDICQKTLQGNAPKRTKTLADALKEMYESKTNKSIRIDTGFPRLDSILMGMNGGNLVIIGARTGVGKTAFALEIARNAALNGQKVLIYSLEMLADELAERIVSRHGYIPLSDLIENNPKWQDVAAISAELSKLPILINDDPRSTAEQIFTQARSIKDLKLIIVDFVTLMKSTSKYQNRNLEVGAISRELKNLAAELQIPIIALAQLNRTNFDTEKPNISALRDSGELEQNANKIMLLWNIEKSENPDIPHKVGINVAKNRRGRTGSVTMDFYGKYMHYVESEEDF